VVYQGGRGIEVTESKQEASGSDPTLTCLNVAFAADPQAMHAIMAGFVPCNRKLADHPHVMVEEHRTTGEDRFALHGIGVLNGALLASGLRPVKLSFVMQDHGELRLVGFKHHPAGPSPVEPAPQGVSLAAEALHSAWEADPRAMQAAMDLAVPCTEALGLHPHIIVDCDPPFSEKTPGVRLIGIINGVLVANGIWRVATAYDKPRAGERLIGFRGVPNAVVEPAGT